MNRKARLLLCLLVCGTNAFAQFELDLSGGDAKPETKATKKAPPRKDKEPARPAEPPRPPEDPVLDLSSTADVKQVVLLPPVVRVTQSQGGFSGFDTRKTFDKFDFAAHKRFVAALQRALEGKVLSAEATQALITKEGFTVALSRSSAGRARLAKAAGAAQVVTLEFNKAGGLAATVHDQEGEVLGEPFTVSNAAALSQKHADELAALLGPGLIELSKPRAVAAAPAEAAPPAPPEEEQVQDSPPPEVTQSPKKGWSPDPDKTRVVVAVGAGGVLRGLSVTGEAAEQLAELRNNGVVGLGVYVQVQPLQFVPSLAGSRWADLELEVNFRRAFVRATGVEGAVEGTSCAMTDDDLQIRGTWRFKVAPGTYAPFVGVGAGWSQERTLFDDCNLPLVSATYRGVDAQLRFRQPLFRNVLALDLSAGPRFLQGDSNTVSRFSLAGEAWLELKPASVFYVRGGARGSRLSAELPGLSITENRFFFALEAGAFL